MEEENIADTTIEFADEAFDDERQIITITYVEGSVNMVFSDDEESTSVVIGDPFKLGECFLYEEILSYLNVKDILSLTEVSQFWKTFIGEISDTSMDRLKVVVNENHDRRFCDVAKNSIRHYRHLEIRGLFDHGNEMTEFIEKNSNWLVSIRTCYEISLPSVILPHVVELFYVGKDMDKSKILFLEEGLIRAAPNLETLSIWAQIKNSDVIKLIINCAHLKKLVLEFGASAAILPEFNRCKDFAFKLETFYCGATLNLFNSCGSFLRFIKMHQDSLKNIKFKGTYELFKEVLHELPKLECLTFYPVVNPVNTNFFQNQQPHAKLKEANLIMTSYHFIQNFLKIAPNLKTLYVSHLTREILKVVTANGIKVESFKFALMGENTLNDLIKFHRLISINMNNNRSKMKIAQI